MDEILQDFVARTATAATRLGLQVTSRPELMSTDFRGGSGEQSLKGAHLPLDISTITVGRFPILFGCLAIAPDVTMVRDGTRRYRNQCVIARSHLPPDQALDLQLWLLGPKGSGDNPEWCSLALAIERDDRVARKLVWLPPSDPNRREMAFKNFLARTFLARPWSRLPQHATAQLDRLSSLPAVVSDLGIDMDVLTVWFDLAISELTDGAELVDALVDAWPSE